MSDKTIVIDPRAWTGPSPDDWPEPQDHAYPQPLQARDSLGKLLTLAVFLGFIGIAGAFSNKRGVAETLMAVVLMAASLAAISRCLRIRKARAPKLVLDARGLTWPEAFERTIPWNEITHIEHRILFGMRGVPGLFIRLRDRERFGPKWPQKMLGLDLSKIDVDLPLPRSLDVSPRKLFRTIQSYRAHFGGPASRVEPQHRP